MTTMSLTLFSLLVSNQKFCFKSSAHDCRELFTDDVLGSVTALITPNILGRSLEKHLRSSVWGRAARWVRGRGTFMVLSMNIIFQIPTYKDLFPQDVLGRCFKWILRILTIPVRKNWLFSLSFWITLFVSSSPKCLLRIGWYVNGQWALKKLTIAEIFMLFFYQQSDNLCAGTSVFPLRSNFHFSGFLPGGGQIMKVWLQPF